MSLAYDKKIAQKLKNIDKKYVEEEDKKELVGGNVRELIDVKEGMGLEGMGLSAGMKKVLRKSKKGKGMSAGAQLGYDGPPVWKDNSVPPFFVAGGMSGGGLLDLVKIPLKLIGLGKNGKKYQICGSGLFDLMNPLKLVKLARMALGDSADGSGMSGGGLLDIVKLPLKLLGLGKDGEEYEMEGGSAIVDSIKNFMRELHPLMLIYREVKRQNKGKGMSAGSERFEGMTGLSAVPTVEQAQELPLKVGGKRGRKGKGMSAGAINRNGNQGLMGFGDIPHQGAGLFDIVGKIANAPSDFLSKINPFEMSSPIDDIFGKERVRKVASSIAENMSGLGKKKGKGMGNRPTTQNMHSSSFSGGAKKVNKRAEVVRKVMKERGVSMIEASKIVKREGLY